MIKYIQHKSIDLVAFDEILSESHKRNHFSNDGPAKLRLENKLKKILKIDDEKAILCTANGTLALHAIYLFLKKRKKEIKIASPSFTFPSCAVGLNEINLLDIDFDSYTMPLTDENIANYDAFVITNLFGTYPYNIKEWVEECSRLNKFLIFDNASSPMTEIDGVNICNFGDFSFGSLHHTKYLGFGEGGFIVLPREHLEEFKKILGFGFTKGTIRRKYNKYSSNYKMSDVAAASILQQVQRYDLVSHKEKQNLIIEQLKDIRNVEVFNYSKGVVYGNMPILFKNIIALDGFRENNIEAQKYYYPLAEHKNSLLLFDRIINLPFHLGIKEEEIERMVKIVKELSNE
jgi:dTDP-4-amino-4,6-dideoxygalactose transaminase